MKRLATSFIILALGATTLFAQGGSQASASDAAPVSIPGELIVKVIASDLSPAEYAERILAPVAAQYGIASIATWLHPALLGPDGTGTFHKSAASTTTLRSLGRILVVRYRSDESPEHVAAKVRQLAGVEYAEPVYRRTLFYTPNDPQLSQQWYLQQVKALEAWDILRADSTITIAITDTGIDPLHPDLKRAIWQNEGETGTDGRGEDRRKNGRDDDANGLIDDWWGYDFGGRDGYSPDNNPSPSYWHGTHVAGIAAASGDNNVGVAGIAFGARVMAVKISDDNALGDPSITKGYDGILYAAKMGAQVINCSWGGPGFSQAELELITMVNEWGVIVVAAAGNNGANISSFPASYPGVLSVAALVQSDHRSTFSNYNMNIGISAPGQGIYSTAPLESGSSGYRNSNGTSMAAPMVAGAAALVMKRYPDLTQEQVIAVLRANADNIDAINPEYQYLLGSGRVNIARALEVGPNAVAATILDYRTVDESGDGIIEPGEIVELRVRVKNLLRPVDDMKLLLAPYGPSKVQIETPLESFGGVKTGQIRESQTGIFRMQVPVDVPLDYKLPLQLLLRDGANDIMVRRVDLIVNPNWGTTAHNRTIATFTGNGRVGFNDFPSNEQGRGFRFDSSKSILAEGGLLIGVAPDRLADVIRSGDIYNQSQGLKTVEPYRVRFSDQEGAQVGSARFDDAHLTDLQRIGIDIRLKTMQFSDGEMANQTILLYTITNTTSAPLRDLFCALYLDWDIGATGAFDKTAIDLEHRLGYSQNTRDHSLPFAGAMLLSDQPMNFNALDNWTSPVANGFYQVEKWEAISSGIKREESNIGDCSMIVGAGPIELAPGADTVIAFSLMAGVNLTELKTSAKEALKRYTAMGGTPGGPIVLPRELRLVESGPNPFRSHVDLEFAMPQEGHASIDIFNSRGELVESLAAGFFPRGTHSVRFTAGGIASEVYFVRMVALNQVLSRKLVYLAP